MDNSVKKSTTKSALEISRIYQSSFQKEGTLRCELKQTKTVTSFYPSKRVDSNLQDNIFSTSDFGYSEKEYSYDKKMVAWIDVPENATIEEVKARLAKLPHACIYEIKDNFPILTDGQLHSITEGLKSKDDFANSQVVRHGSDDIEGRWVAGDLALDNLGRPVYVARFFSSTDKEDIDKRNSDSSKFYVSPEIEAEMKLVSAFSAEQTV